MAIMNYATVGSNKLDEAKAFYDTLFASANIPFLFDHPSGGRIYGEAGKFMFGVLGTADGKPACVGNGNMVAFSFETKQEVDAFHKKALELGAADEGTPGDRGPNMYFSYFRDLDGNKISAYHIG